MIMSVVLFGHDSEGDKVWLDQKSGRVTYNETQQGAEWTFEMGGGTSVENYEKRVCPITQLEVL
jgi:hypothetical protein